MPSVLVTGMGSTTAISVVKGLRRQSDLDIRIIGVDINEKCEIAGSYFCDVFYTVPRGNAPHYIQKLIDICTLEGIRIIFPIIDLELEIIAANIDVFHMLGIHVWISDSATIQICNNKHETFRFLSSRGFRTPKSWLPEDIIGIEDLLPYPLIVKPVDGVSSINVFRVDSPFELENTVRRLERPLIQEYLEGTEYTVDVLADYSSTILAVVPRERIETKAGISYKGRTVRDIRLIDLASQIAQALHIKGPCNIQCRITDGDPSCFEINPRFSGTLPLTIEAGINSPLILTKLSTGIALDQEYFNFKEGIYMARYWEEIFYHD